MGNVKELQLLISRDACCVLASAMGFRSSQHKVIHCKGDLLFYLLGKKWGGQFWFACRHKVTGVRLDCLQARVQTPMRCKSSQEQTSPEICHMRQGATVEQWMTAMDRQTSSSGQTGGRPEGNSCSPACADSMAAADSPADWPMSSSNLASACR